MGRWSINIIGVINAITFFLSIAIVGLGIWLATHGDSICYKFLQWPVIGVGLFLLILSMAGFTGACFRVTWVLWVYMFFMFLLILLLIGFTIFTFVYTNKGAGDVVPNRAFKEYQLGDYANWLQNHVNNSPNWRKIKSCLQDTKICKKLADDRINETPQEFYSQNLSPIQSGCCKPPTSCNFTFVNATVWTANSANNTNPDCMLWSNNQDQLCYGCSSCKAGVLATLRHDWKKVVIVNAVVLVVLVLVYSVACSAWRYIRRDSGHHQHGHLKRNYPKLPFLGRIRK